jgi:hypothetical protein
MAWFVPDKCLAAHLRAAGRKVPDRIRVRVLARGIGPGARNVLVVGEKGIPFVTSWRSVTGRW